jgi:hypothetical protein
MSINIGCNSQNLELMMLGRLIYGLGGECQGVTSNILMVVWFGGKELGFASVHYSFISM